jgi:outer membrane lipoprotein-sorting protein
VSELAERLELLHEARHRYRTARGVMRRRHNWRLTQEAVKRANARSRRGGMGHVQMFASGSGGAETQPDVHEEVIRFWVEPPDRLRHETESSGRGHTIVIDGDTWWMYSPEWGATSNVGLTDEEAGNMSVGGGEPFRQLLDPSMIAGALEIDRIDAEEKQFVVHAHMREDLDGINRHMLMGFVTGADAVELVVDRERGIVRRITAYLDGQELSASVLDDVVFDEAFPEGTFVFVPPPGEEVHPPETARQHTHTVSEVVELAGFVVFEIPDLPEGQWRLHVHYNAKRERPRMHENAALFYSRSDGRGTVIVSQHEAGAEGTFGWPGVRADEASLEEIERDGIRYVVFRGAPDQDMGSAVRLERDGTAVQLQSQDLPAETLLELATSLRPAE